MGFQEDWLDIAIRRALRSSVAGLEPSPQVWEQIATRTWGGWQFEAALACGKGWGQLYYPRLLSQHAGEIVTAFVSRLGV